MAFSYKKVKMQGAGYSTMEDRRTQAHCDVPLILITYALILYGIYLIAIATFNPDKGTDLSLLNYILNSSYASWQSVFAMAGGVMLVFIYAVPYELLRVQLSRIGYISICALLVIAYGTEAIGGVTAWIPIGRGRTIQPAEFIKIGIILMLARSLSSTEKPFGTAKNALHNFVLFIIPAGLTVLQGEIGSVLVMCVIFYVMLYFSDVEPWILISIMVLAVVAVGALLGYMLISGSDSFRLRRILAFLDPQAYYDSAGYQLLYSQMAIGSGQETGIGAFVTGSISQLKYVPENHTDFIFSVLGEAFGFAGCMIAIGLYILLLLRMLYLAHYTVDMYGKLVIVGVMAMFFAHIVENIGMTLGLMPITGIPLPFLSYGGSNFVTNIAGIGLVLNMVKNRSSTMAMRMPTMLMKKKTKHRRGKHAKQRGLI